MRKKQQRIGKISIFVEDRFRLSKTLSQGSANLSSIRFNTKQQKTANK